MALYLGQKYQRQGRNGSEKAIRLGYVAVIIGVLVHIILIVVIS